MTVCHIALGGNIGSVSETFERALQMLARHVGIAVIQSSRIYTTTAIGTRAGDAFSNAAAEIETDLDPFELFAVLQAIENSCGRTRGQRWAPRTLDLDLIFYGDRVIDEPKLQVPHPAAWYRRFVLDPLAEICPDARHPERGLSVGELREQLLPRPFHCGLAGGTQNERRRLYDRLAEFLPDVEFQECGDRRRDECLAATIVVWLGKSRDESSLFSYEELPRHSRLDAGMSGIDQFTFIATAVQSALG